MTTSEAKNDDYYFLLLFGNLWECARVTSLGGIFCQSPNTLDIAREQCDQIGRFLKAPLDMVSNKSIQNVKCEFLG